jgi:hypothetical protein
LEKRDLIRVDWFDASDERCSLEGHKNPEVLVSEFGVYLGCEGQPRHILVGKHFVKRHRVWEATRIPVSLVDSIVLICKASAPELWLRRYTVIDYRPVRQVRRYV